ncbi:hypothetical protein P7K49_021932, partial [Saguinus oedipus]
MDYGTSLHLGMHLHVHIHANSAQIHTPLLREIRQPPKTIFLSDKTNGTICSSGLFLIWPLTCPVVSGLSRAHDFPSITLSAHRFVMLSLEFDYMCQYDYVEVRDGDNRDSQIIKRVCGNERPAPVQSTGSSLHVLFHSDGSKNFDGFHAIFEEIT